MKLLIALDGPGGAETAVADLKRAGLPPRVECLVLSVADVILPAGDQGKEPPHWLAEQIEKARARGAEAVGQARGIAEQGQRIIETNFPEWTVRAEACADSPAWAIMKKAEEFHAALIVVGSHDRSAIGRLMLGSVSQSVLHHASASVRISRPSGRADNIPVHLVAGDDGSDDADAALSALAARAWPAGTTVHLVTAVDQAMATMGLWSLAEAGTTDWVTEVNQRSVAKLRAAGLTVLPSVTQGDPRRILLSEAEHCNADCIFVGARGLRAIERLFLGSVSSAIASRAHCSVEVVRSRLASA